jgi:hypothetical protein
MIATSVPTCKNDIRFMKNGRIHAGKSLTESVEGRRKDERAILSGAVAPSRPSAQVSRTPRAAFEWGAALPGVGDALKRGIAELGQVVRLWLWGFERDADLGFALSR